MRAVDGLQLRAIVEHAIQIGVRRRGEVPKINGGQLPTAPEHRLRVQQQRRVEARQVYLLQFVAIHEHIRHVLHLRRVQPVNVSDGCQIRKGFEHVAQILRLVVGKRLIKVYGCDATVSLPLWADTHIVFRTGAQRHLQVVVERQRAAVEHGIRLIACEVTRVGVGHCKISFIAIVGNGAHQTRAIAEHIR